MKASPVYFLEWRGLLQSQEADVVWQSPLHRARQDLATSVSLDMSLNLSETQCICKRKGLDRWFLRNLPDMKLYDTVLHLYSNVSKWRKKKMRLLLLFGCSVSVTPWTAAHQASLSLTIFQFTQVHIHCICDAVQPPHPLKPSSSSALNLSQH